MIASRHAVCLASDLVEVGLWWFQFVVILCWGARKTNNFVGNYPLVLPRDGPQQRRRR